MQSKKVFEEWKYEHNEDEEFVGPKYIQQQRPKIIVLNYEKL